MRRFRTIIAAAAGFSMLMGLCAGAAETETEIPAGLPAEETESEAPESEEPEKNGEVYILFTSDIHCGVDKGFGLAGVKQVQETLEAEGYTTLLVDNGDAIQGEAIGTLSKGEDVIELMNAMGYDIEVPGNHEFDYGMERFFELVDMADFPYISCNFNYKGELVFAPYTILEAAGLKIGFVGVTTPTTITTSTPTYFQDEDGNYVYGFFQEDRTGQKVYDAVQEAADAARADGADLVYVMGHIGIKDNSAPWTYIDIISHTDGIDVFLDGHSHDTDQAIVENKDGEPVPRSACGTKLDSIGYSHISADGEVLETGIWSWPNTETAQKLFSIHNEISDAMDEVFAELDETLGEVIARTDVDLTINDPVKVDDSDNPIRIVRRSETNLGDFCTDAIRDQTGADIAIINGGGVRATIRKGDITYGDILSVFPFGNQISVMEVTGQQVLDALEWGSSSLPDEDGKFFQVSGISYVIDTSIDSPCITDENGMLAGIEGDRRVKNVMVGEEALDPEKTYTLASIDYLLINHGGGNTEFDDAVMLKQGMKLDNQVLIDYITQTLGGVVGDGYENPTGQGRITILE